MESCCVPYVKSMEELAQNLEARFVLATDGNLAFDRAISLHLKANLVMVTSKNYIESVLDDALYQCDGDYILRLDDDESASPAMQEWLKSETWTSADHWTFPRMHFWDGGTSILMTPHLFPDHQTRLSVKEKSGGRYGVHAGSPFGYGEVAPVAIQHHKFIIKTYEARRSIAAKYDNYSPGYGTGNMKPFSLPEDAYRGSIVKLTAPWNGAVPWVPLWEREEQW